VHALRTNRESGPSTIMVTVTNFKVNRLRRIHGESTTPETQLQALVTLVTTVYDIQNLIDQHDSHLFRSIACT